MSLAEALVEGERQRGGIAEAGRIEAASRAVQLREHSFRVGRKCRFVPPRVEIDVAEAESRFDRKQLAVRIEIRLQFAGRRLDRFGAFGDEFQFLRDPPPDDRIVPVQTQRKAFAVQHLFADVAADKLFQFRIRRRPLPGAREQPGHAFDLALRDDDPARLAGAAPRQNPVSREQHGPQQQKMQQRFPEQPLDHPGMYRIGDLHRIGLPVLGRRSGRAAAGPSRALNI